MTMHLLGFYNAAGNPTPGGIAIVPAPDPVINIQGNNAMIPDVTRMICYAGGMETAHAFTDLQLQSPTLRKTWFPSLTPSPTAAAWATIPEISDFGESPLELTTNEGLQVVATGATAGATVQQALVCLCDGPITPTKGKIFTYHFAPNTIQQVVGTWVNGPLTLGQQLPVGTYDVVGMRVDSADGIGARLVFIGKSGVSRPGVPCTAALSNIGHRKFRFGGYGVFGTFDSTALPSIDIFSGVAAAQQVTLDLIQR